MLTIYNSLTQTKEEFKPIDEGKIGIYVCGITTYDYLHLGHARMLVAFDVITRYLRARGFEVNYVRNITDIDDKILNRAAENGELFSDLTDRFIEAMHEDEAALAVLPPDVEPRATGHITEIINMISSLIEKAHTVFDQPECFAPHGLQQAISDVSGNFGFEGNRLHANLTEYLLGAIDSVLSHLRRWDDFDYGQEVNRIVGMRNQYLLRPLTASLQLRGHEA